LNPSAWLIVIVPPQSSFLIAAISTTPSAGDLTFAAFAAKSTPVCCLPHLGPKGELTDVLSTGIQKPLHSPMICFH
jgi:hypothetical protein